MPHQHGINGEILALKDTGAAENAIGSEKSGDSHNDGAKAQAIIEKV